MKKAKLILSTIGLLAVLGGAVAFKASKFNGGLKCSTVPTTLCPIIATTIPVQGQSPRSLYCTTLNAPTCNVMRTVYSDL